MTKSIILSALLVVLSIAGSFAQQSYTRPFAIEYGLIIDSTLYINEDSLGTAVSDIRAYHLNESRLPLLTENSALVNDYFPSVWDIQDTLAFVVSAYGSSTRSQFELIVRPLGQQDSLQLAQAAAAYYEANKARFEQMTEDILFQLAVTEALVG